MPPKRHSSEQIISKLREAEVHLSQGITIPLMCKKLGIHQQTSLQCLGNGDYPVIILEGVF